MNGVELVASWFTPTVLFCVLNLMIGTIFITSSLKPQQKQGNMGDNEDSQPPQLARVPSLLERVKSINLSRYRSEQSEQAHYAVPAQEQVVHQVDHEHASGELHHVTRSKSDNEDSQPPQLARVPSFLERVKSINLSRYWSEQSEQAHHAVPAQEQVDHERESEELHHVTRSKSDKTAKATPAARVLKKSASEKVVPAENMEEEVDQRRPATVREITAAFREEDDAVDAKADDFINRFRQQLKLQRLDSILRYKEMLNRGTKS